MDDVVGTPDWSRLPPPDDDGAVRHLGGARLPPVALRATDGGTVHLAARRGRSVVYIHPRTGRPGVPNPDGWAMIHGARGCSPQSCAFRDHSAELKRLGVEHFYGLSTQDTAYQREAAERLHLPMVNRDRPRVGSHSSGARAHAHCNSAERSDPHPSPPGA